MTALHEGATPANVASGWTVDDSEFGARLALVRQQMKWNIKEAARECGIPAASWGTWENGAMPRRYTEMCRLIARRTGCDYAWLLDGPRLKGASHSVTLDLDAIAKALDLDPAELRSRVGEQVSRDFDQAPAERVVAIGQALVDVPVRGSEMPEPRRIPHPFSQPKPKHNRPVSAVPARKRRPAPVRPGIRPTQR